MTKVHLDFETRSRVDLTKRGAAIYAEDPSTDIHCIAYAPETEPVRLITKNFGLHGNGDLLNASARPQSDLWSYAYQPAVLFIAHNAFFEQVIWAEIMVKRYGYPPIPIDRWRCTAAKAFAHGLPGALVDVGYALKLDVQKDQAGYFAMMKLCRPTAPNDTFWTPDTAPEDFKTLYEYCMRDVETERLLDQTLRDLSPKEQRIWQIDQRINQTGICLDMRSIEAALALSTEHKEILAKACKDITKLNPTQGTKLQAWLEWAQGKVLPNMQKGTLNKLLKQPDLPAELAAVVKLRLEANKTSLSKYSAMVQRSKNGICREMYQYHGAHTGRFAGRGVQWDNLARNKGVNVDIGISTLSWRLYDLFTLFFSDVAGTLSQLLRSMVIARPGCRLLQGDFSQIEARLTAWIAGQEDTLDAFRAYDAGTGPDIYCIEASRIYGYEIKKGDEKRQVGKVANLSLGFGGGIRAFDKMAKGYQVDLAPVAPGLIASASSEEIDKAEWSYTHYLKQKPEEPVSRDVGYACDIIKQRWRAANANVVSFWAEIERAAIKAVHTGAPVACGRLTWFMNERFLYCKLPSGRCMAYPYPQVKVNDRGGAKLTYMGKHPITGSWARLDTYGGKLTENVVQAMDRDCLVEAMLRTEDSYPALMHLHDAIVCEMPEDQGSLVEYCEIVGTPPSWAEGLPIAVDGKEGFRYG